MHAPSEPPAIGPPLDALVVGAGPAGLALAAMLRALGATFRIVDRAPSPADESRAFAVQARTLEHLDALGLAAELVRRGTAATRVLLHVGGARTAELRPGDVGASDTRFPFILIVPQRETEAVLGDHLADAGVAVERGVGLAAAEEEPDGTAVRCALRHADGGEETVRARWLVGCDGAHSTVRRIAGIAFAGGTSPHDFLLGDVEVDGPLERGAIHPFLGGRGLAIAFPLGTPTTWRVVAVSRRPPGGGDGGNGGNGGDGGAHVPPTLDELQTALDGATDGATDGALRLRDPAWLARFRVHHRQAARYRHGRIFLVGDAAHVHSPVGGQGMNAGVGDAWNLGWKLALVARGLADESLLDTYEAERWPVGRRLVETTDRAFALATRAAADAGLAPWLRRVVGGHLIPRLIASHRVRARGFRFVAQLGIRYRTSPAVAEGEPRLREGPWAGDRLPDAPVRVNGRDTWLLEALGPPGLDLLLCGAAGGWDPTPIAPFATGPGAVLRVRHLTRDDVPGAIVDRDGALLARLGVRDGGGAQYLVRPDGHVGYRCAGRDLGGVARWLADWLSVPAAATPPNDAPA